MTAMKAVDDTDFHVARKIASIRIDKKLTQADLGRALGVSRYQIMKYECGRNRITLGAFVKIAKALGVKPASLLP